MHKLVRAKLKKCVLFLVHYMQRTILFLSYWSFHFGNKNKWSWVVGVDEIAHCTKFISGALEPSYSVCFMINRRYRDTSYSFSLPSMPPLFSLIARLFVGPVLLGYLSNRASGFFYIGSGGFLANGFDARDYEFSFLKRKNKKIINFYCGSEIRSLLLSIELATKLKLEVIANYYRLAHPEIQLDFHEKFIKKFVASSEAYADIIFNAPIDQISYFTREVSPFFYAYPDDKYIKNDLKFDKFDPVIIVHAPSSPLLKGTQLVRAAIKKLQVEGYLFEYIELIDAPNEHVIKTLHNAHIAVNQFYAFMPGVFSIEAMAAHCAVLTSADPAIETTLPLGANEAWFVTRYWEIYDNLKCLLDKPALIKRYADSGYEWTYKHYRASFVREYLREYLKKELDLSND